MPFQLKVERLPIEFIDEYSSPQPRKNNTSLNSFTLEIVSMYSS
jgi:hypothetical protein